MRGQRVGGGKIKNEEMGRRKRMRKQRNDFINSLQKINHSKEQERRQTGRENFQEKRKSGTDINCKHSFKGERERERDWGEDGREAIHNRERENKETSNTVETRQSGMRKAWVDFTLINWGFRRWWWRWRWV